MNNQRFDNDTNCERSGILEDGCAILYNQAFNEFCESGHFFKEILPFHGRSGKTLFRPKTGSQLKVKKMRQAQLQVCVPEA